MLGLKINVHHHALVQLPLTHGRLVIVLMHLVEVEMLLFMIGHCMVEVELMNFGVGLMAVAQSVPSGVRMAYANGEHLDRDRALHGLGEQFGQARALTAGHGAHLGQARASQACLEINLDKLGPRRQCLEINLDKSAW